MSTDLYDLAIIGGGINGTGIARDAAGRGLRVVLIERDDLANHTSSSSTKLIHGGLRYLEQYEFGLVRKALAEREILLASAPHIMAPLRFVMPHSESSSRPAWMIRIGLFLYDHLARRRTLGRSRAIDLANHRAGAALKPEYTRGFEYADGWVDDARLVILNAMDAQDRGATILPRHACVAAKRDEHHWHLTLRTGSDNRPITIRSRALVNATGPWAASFLGDIARQTSPEKIRLVRGSHIIVPALFDHPQAYILQNDDGRVVFAIPYQHRFTLIGSTEVDHHHGPETARASADEIAYLCRAVGRYFQRGPSPSDVIHSFSGVRPLPDDGQIEARKVSRDYHLHLDTDGPPLLNVFGGKLTTYRCLAEDALRQLAPLLATVPGGHSANWTAHQPLPGGNLPEGDFAAFLAQLLQQHPNLPAGMLQRWAHAYGSRVQYLLKNIQGPASLGKEIISGLYACEIDYLIDHEWARTAQDVLWRRSKLGLHFAAQGASVLKQAEARLDGWMMECLDGGRT